MKNKNQMNPKSRILQLFCILVCMSATLLGEEQNGEKDTSPLMIFRIGESKKEEASVSHADGRNRSAGNDSANQVLRGSFASCQEKETTSGEQKVGGVQKESRRNSLFLWVKEALMSGGESIIEPMMQKGKQERLLREQELAAIERAIEGAAQEHRRAFKGYQEADAHWNKAAEGWQLRSEAQKQAATYEEQVAHSRSLLDQERAIREATNAKKTKLGKLSRYTAKAAGVLSFVNTPFVTPSGVLSTVSAVADQANKYQINASYRTAKRANKKAEKASSKASEAYEEAMRAAPELEEMAEAREQDAKKELVQNTIKLAQSLKPPAADKGIEHWTKWAEALATLTRQDISLTKALAFHGRSNPDWAHGVTAKGWKKQLELSQERLADLEEEQTEGQRKAQQVYQEFERSKKATEKIEQKIKQIKEKQVQLAGQRENDKRNLHEANQALTQLDGTDPAAVEEKRKLIRTAITALKKSSREWDQYKSRAEEEKEALEKELAAATTASAKLLEEYFAHEKTILRKQDRAKMEAMTDEILWKTLWPDYEKKNKQTKVGDLGNVVQRGRSFFESLSEKSTKPRGEQKEATDQQKEFWGNLQAAELIAPALARVENAWRHLTNAFSRQDEIVDLQKQRKEYENIKKEIAKTAEHASERSEEASTFIKGVAEGKDETFGNIFHHASDAARCIAVIAKANNAAQVEPYLKTVAKSAKSAVAESNKLNGSPWEEEATWGASLAQDAVELAKRIAPQATEPVVSRFPNLKKKEVVEQALGHIFKIAKVDSTSQKAEMSPTREEQTPNPLPAKKPSFSEESSSQVGSPLPNKPHASEEKKIESAFLQKEEEALSAEKEIVLEVRHIATQVKANLLDQEAADIAEEKKLMEEREKLAQEEKELMARMEACTTADETVLESVMLLQEVIEQEKEVIEQEEAVLAEREIIREELREKIQIQEEEIEEQRNLILEEEQKVVEQLQEEPQTIAEEKKERALQQAQEEEEQQKIEEMLRQRALQQAKELAAQKEAEVAAREKALEEARIHQEKLAASKEESQRIFYEKALASVQAEQKAIEERKMALEERERRIQEKQKAKAARKAASRERIQALKAQLEAIEEQNRQLAEREAAAKKAEEESDTGDDGSDLDELNTLVARMAKVADDNSKKTQKSEKLKRENNDEFAEEVPSPSLVKKEAASPKLPALERLKKRMEKNRAKKEAEEEMLRQRLQERMKKIRAQKEAEEGKLKTQGTTQPVLGELPDEVMSFADVEEQISELELATKAAYENKKQREIEELRNKVEEMRDRALEFEGNYTECRELIKEVLYEVAKKLEEAIKFKEEGEEIANLYIEAAREQERSIKFYEKQQALNARGDDDKHRAWLMVGLAFHRAGDNLGKVIRHEITYRKEKKWIIEIEGEIDEEREIWLNEFLEDAKLWHEYAVKVAQKYERSAGFFEKAAIAWDSGNDPDNTEYDTWEKVGETFLTAADTLAKGINTRPEDAKLYEEIASSYERSAELFEKGAITYLSGNADGAKYWNDAGDQFYSIAIRLEENSFRLKSIIEQTSEETSEEILEEKEQLELEAASIQKQQYYAEFFVKAATAYASKEGVESGSLSATDMDFYNALVKFEGGATSRIDENPEVAKLWYDVLDKMARSAEFYKKGKREYDAEERECFYNLAFSLFDSAETLIKLIEAEKQGDEGVVQLWKEVVKKKESSLQCYQKAAGHYDENTPYDENDEYGPKYWSYQGEHFAKDAAKLAKAIELEARGEKEQADALRKEARAVDEVGSYFYWDSDDDSFIEA